MARPNDFLQRRESLMRNTPTSVPTAKADVPYVSKDEKTVVAYWDGTTAHRGVVELCAYCRCAPKAAEDCKEQIALPLDADVLARYRAQDAGWLTGPHECGLECVSGCDDLSDLAKQRTAWRRLGDFEAVHH